MAGLLNIGEMGALALHEMVELAILRRSDPGGRLTILEIADRLHASVHTLQKVTRRLVALGLVSGARGVGGGLALAADPGSVTLLSIIEGVEGRVCSNGCMFGKRVCGEGVRCLFGGVTEILEGRVREYFAETTLETLCEQAATAGSGLDNTLCAF